VSPRRWDFISENRAAFGVKRICGVLGVSRSGCPTDPCRPPGRLLSAGSWGTTAVRAEPGPGDRRRAAGRLRHRLPRPDRGRRTPNRLAHPLLPPGTRPLGLSVARTDADFVAEVSGRTVRRAWRCPGSEGRGCPQRGRWRHPRRCPWPCLTFGFGLEFPTDAFRACPADHAADAGLGTPSPRGGTPSGVVVTRRLPHSRLLPQCLKGLGGTPERGDPHRVDALLRLAAARTKPRSPASMRHRRCPPT
jgi:hypothetical protein